MRAAPAFFQKVSVFDAKAQNVRLALMAAQIASDLKEGADTKDSRAPRVGMRACSLVTLACRSVAVACGLAGNATALRPGPRPGHT
eukprot:1913249-Alexandrium_andersonii.AAC.1